MTATFFNLLVNSAFSMFCGLVVVSFFIWLFRVETGPWKLFLWSLPFVKIIVDCVRGLPANSVLLSGIDPFTLPPRHQMLQVGGGINEWGAFLNVILSVQDTAGQLYAASLGDYLVIWLNRTFGAHIPLIILSVAMTVSATLLTMRLIAAFRFERRRKQERLSALTIRSEHLRFRTVDIYLSTNFSGTPFTGGLFKPYICIPKDAFEKLDEPELKAVVAHELGHIRQFDLPVTVAIQLLGDVFWFIPGYRWLSRKIDRMREIVADQWAVKSGIQPILLASALVKLKEIPETADRFVLYSAFFREKSLLKIRIERLLERVNEKRPRFGWRNIWLRSIATVLIFTAVMFSTLGGNHSGARAENPKWFNSLLKDLGIED